MDNKRNESGDEEAKMMMKNVKGTRWMIRERK
jgi:hypothetical protein